MSLRLCDLTDGQCARVVYVNSDGAIARRLLDLGVTVGAKVCCVVRSPAGDPAGYLIRGAVIALRRADAATIEVAP